jgi:hypothetical protein
MRISTIERVFVRGRSCCVTLMRDDPVPQQVHEFSIMCSMSLHICCTEWTWVCRCDTTSSRTPECQLITQDWVLRILVEPCDTIDTRNRKCQCGPPMRLVQLLYTSSSSEFASAITEENTMPAYAWFTFFFCMADLDITSTMIHSPLHFQQFRGVICLLDPASIFGIPNVIMTHPFSH